VPARPRSHARRFVGATGRVLDERREVELIAQIVDGLEVVDEDGHAAADRDGADAN
jgi:hypothetical protein